VDVKELFPADVAGSLGLFIVFPVRYVVKYLSVTLLTDINPVSLTKNRGCTKANEITNLVIDSLTLIIESILQSLFFSLT